MEKQYMMRWIDNLKDTEWDVLLCELGGHPLQSALWGQAKKVAYGTQDRRVALYIQDKLVALMRIENKGIPVLCQVAWIPQGPTIADSVLWKQIEKDVLTYIKKAGHATCVMNPWQPLGETKSQKEPKRKTIWIDLQPGREALLAALDKQWRYGVRFAERAGVKTSIATTKEELSDFYQLCVALSKKKTFRFSHSLLFLQYLLNHGSKQSVEAKLFLSKYEEKIAAGALILRAGKNIHYLCGAVDRQYSKQRAGEFVQWSVMEWACDNGYARYDLEGIDLKENSSVAAFKKKMGGEIIALPDTQINSLNLRGNILSKLIQKKLE